jgi:fructose transport system permease protein
MKLSQSAAEVEFAESETGRSIRSRAQGALHKYPTLSPALVLIISIAVFWFLNPNFKDPINLSLILQQVAIVGAIAIGQTIIVLTAGIDLSCGAIAIFSSMVMAKLTFDDHFPILLSFAIGLAVGTGAGAFNGFLVTKVKLPPFIVTLGTFNVFTALTLLFAKGRTVRDTEIDPFLLTLGKILHVGKFNISYGVLAMIAMYLILAYALRYTAWGRHVYATGDDIEAARLAGIQTNRVLMSVYVVAGFIFAMTAWIIIGRVNAASPNSGQDLNLDSITAVVIGGTSLFGGRGRIIGSLFGAVIVGVFRNGLTLAGLDPYYQTLAVGILIISAVTIDQWIRKAHK